MKRVYIKPVTEELLCDNGLMLCDSKVTQGIESDDPEYDGEGGITTDPNKNPFDD